MFFLKLQNIFVLHVINSMRTNNRRIEFMDKEGTSIFVAETMRIVL